EQAAGAGVDPPDLDDRRVADELEARRRDRRGGPYRCVHEIVQLGAAARSGVGGGRVYGLADLGDLVGREAAQPRMFVDDLLVAGEVDAEGLVGGDVALDPLDVGAEFLERGVRLLGRGLERLALRTADGRKLAFDDKAAHVPLPLRLGRSDWA